MKHKFSSMGRVAIALVLALSLSLVMAAPAAAADPTVTQGICLEEGIYETGDAGEASWTEAVGGITPPAGNYMVELTYGDDTLAATVAKVRYSGTLSALSTLATADESGMTFNYYYDTTSSNPYAAVYLDTDDDGVADMVLLSKQLVPAVEDTWNVAHVTTDVGYDGGWHVYAYDAATSVVANPSSVSIKGVTYDSNEWKTLAGWTALDTDPATTTFGDDADVLYVGYMLGGCGDKAGKAYVDDITIGDTTYELEPIFLDKVAYNAGATVQVTVPNFAANTDPIRKNPVTAETASADTDWEVTVTSTSDPSGITVVLEETGINTGVFTGEFITTSAVSPPEDELRVQDGDAINVEYAGDWGAGKQPLAPYTLAEVDDTAPTITVPEPLIDGVTTDNRMPEISATYKDAPDVSGIDKDSVEIIFDGVDVTDGAEATISEVTYTPEDDLVDGSYEVTVNVSDLAGNEATETWSFRVVSWLVDPESDTNVDELDALEEVGVAVSITPDTIKADITVGRYASNPEPEAALTFTTIENGFFDVEVTSLTDTAAQIIIKFADDNITADSTAYVWSELDGVWLECSDQYYNPTAKYLRVKVRVTDTTPNISELGGTPFAISGEPAVEEDISTYYKGLTGDAEVVDTADLLTAANDWADAVVPSGFTESITSIELIALANEWAATE